MSLDSVSVITKHGRINRKIVKWYQPCLVVRSRVTHRSETCRSAKLVRQFCEMKIFCRERRRPALVQPRSCRRPSLQQQHLSTNAARVTAGGTVPRRRCATMQCDHEVTALDTVAHDMHMHRSYCELWQRPFTDSMVLSIISNSIK